MRIAGGELRGRTLKLPKGVDLRPTEERVRLALFNIVGPLLPGSRFLDLCCGTGAVGLEALSRGAAFVAFADREPRCLRSLKEHLELFGIDPSHYELFSADYVQCLSRLESRKDSYDLIFVDPPYETEIALDALQRLSSLAILENKAASRLIVEHDGKKPLPQEAGRLQLLKRYPYGKSSLSLYGSSDAN